MAANVVIDLRGVIRPDIHVDLVVDQRMVVVTDDPGDVHLDVLACIHTDIVGIVSPDVSPYIQGDGLAGMRQDVVAAVRAIVVADLSRSVVRHLGQEDGSSVHATDRWSICSDRRRDMCGSPGLMCEAAPEVLCLPETREWCTSPWRCMKRQVEARSPIVLVVSVGFVGKDPVIRVTRNSSSGWRICIPQRARR